MQSKYRTKPRVSPTKPKSVTTSLYRPAMQGGKLFDESDFSELWFRQSREILSSANIQSKSPTKVLKSLTSDYTFSFLTAFELIKRLRTDTDDFHSLFVEHDADKDGILTLAEFSCLIHRMKIQPDEMEKLLNDAGIHDVDMKCETVLKRTSGGSWSPVLQHQSSQQQVPPPTNQPPHPLYFTQQYQPQQVPPQTNQAQHAQYFLQQHPPQYFLQQHPPQQVLYPQQQYPPQFYQPQPVPPYQQSYPPQSASAQAPPQRPVFDELWERHTKPESNVSDRRSNLKTFASICREVIRQGQARLLFNLPHFDRGWTDKTFTDFIGRKIGDDGVYAFLKANFDAREMDRGQFETFVHSSATARGLIEALLASTTSASAPSFPSASAQSTRNPQIRLEHYELSALFAYVDWNRDNKVDFDEVLHLLSLFNINPKTGDKPDRDPVGYLLSMTRSREFSYTEFTKMVQSWHQNLLSELRTFMKEQDKYVLDGWERNGARWRNTSTGIETHRHPGYKTNRGQTSQLQISTQPMTTLRFKITGSDRVQVVHQSKRSPVFQFATKLFTLTSPDQLGYGRDVDKTTAWYQGHPRPPRTRERTLMVKHIWKIENNMVWNKFSNAHQDVMSEITQLKARGHHVPPVETTIDQNVGKLVSSRSGDVLSDDVNEKYLLHGTKFRFIRDMMNKGFNERMCGKGLFGAGNYFGDTPEKTDQYSTSHNLASVEDEELLNMLFPANVKREDHLHYNFLCRVILGVPQESRDQCTERRECDVFQDRVKYHSFHGVPGPGHDRHHEYIQYHGDRIYPAYLIAYRRCFDGDPADV